MPPWLFITWVLRFISLPATFPCASCHMLCMLCRLSPGGHDPSWRGLKAVELYDPVQDSWKLGPMLPSALPFAGAGVATKGQVYIIGGGERARLMGLNCVSVWRCRSMPGSVQCTLGLPTNSHNCQQTATTAGSSACFLRALRCCPLPRCAVL